MARSNDVVQYTEDESWYPATRAQRAWFASGCTTLLISLAKSILIISGSTNRSKTLLQTTLAGLVGYIMADLSSGIYHWAVDNYGSPKTTLFGSNIKSFTAHHEQPLAITKYEIANAIDILAGLVTITYLPIALFANDPVVLSFCGVVASCGMFSVKIHAWAHTSREELPLLVVALQDAGIILSSWQHAAHHEPPYNSNYCTVSGVWNRVLDKFKVYRALEVGLFHVIGVRPRSWSNTKSE